MLANETYTNRIVQIVLFFWEMYEEGEGGHSEIIGMMAKLVGTNAAQLKKKVLIELYQERQLSIVGAADALAEWLDEQHLSPDGCDLAEIKNMLRSGCQPLIVAKRQITETEKVQRSFMRMARCLRMMHDDIEVGRHSRIFEYFYPVKALPSGKSHSPDPRVHPEHVVPCAYIRDHFLEYFEKNGAEASLNEVAALLEKWLMIVWISENERKKLDDGINSLRDKMPLEWSPVSGCIFARLHEKEIKFDPPLSLGCACL